ncbi:hypothetical protein NEOLEDRAFT_427187 [Neolentinus lepideus HHB14362 ss-1]|uniref:Hepatocellular carcinoma-associated antigen 59 n=1 Tax=Neolentinus lepideus HHB14362 ss-1 TaxID=1314782 RepID=A0A165S1Y8_9AGAM|nr:hypothetical protein NEOLEDRAFT_427187 [Neolentinus lepideus HHB14362 ss-1]
MIKKRTRPQPRLRERSVDAEESNDPVAEEQEEDKVDLEDLIELRKLRRAREGIDVTKLNKGEAKRKKKRALEEEEDRGGLRAGASTTSKDPTAEEDEDEDQTLKARKAVRSNNFTQQTNALDADKHMMAYIEENMKLRYGRPDDSEDKDEGPADPYAELYRLSERYKVDKKAAEEGSVTNSVAMLTAIPEVDLGMDVRLKNIEDTEKMKRMVAEQKKERKPDANNDEEHLAAARFYRPNYKPKSDADIMRDAKMEAMGMPPQEDTSRSYNHRPQMATDELVMERFKKRMRK